MLKIVGRKMLQYNDDYIKCFSDERHIRKHLESRRYSDIARRIGTYIFAV